MNKGSFWAAAFLLLCGGAAPHSFAAVVGETVAQPERSAERAYRAAGIDADSMLGLADVNLKRGRIQEAERYLREALAAAPERMDVQMAWGRYLVWQKKFDEAIKAYRQAIALDSKHAGARYGLGVALAATGDLTAAKTELQEASRLAPTNPYPFEALGRLYAISREYERALEAFATAIAIQPQFIPAYSDRGDVYVAMDRDDLAIVEYTTALEVAPRFAEAHVKIGMIHQRHQRFDEASVAYVKAIALNPSLAIAYNNLAWMAAERKQELEEAVIWAKKAVELMPRAAQFQDTLGWVYRAQGNLSEAAAVLERAAAMEPPQAETWYHLGLVYAEQGRPTQARDALEKSLSLNGQFSGVEDAKARLKALRGSKSG